MKRLEYEWEEEHYLLHVQLTAMNGSGAVATLTRTFADDRSAQSERIVVQPGCSSHRVLVSRTHPAERSFRVDYPAATTLEIFRLEDRAYYPTQLHRAG